MAQIIKGGVEYNFGSSNTDSSSMEIVTREEYDTLVANGTVKTGVYYFITEETSGNKVVSAELTATADNIGRVTVNIPIYAKCASFYIKHNEYTCFPRWLNDNECILYIRHVDNLSNTYPANTDVTYGYSYIKE